MPHRRARASTLVLTLALLVCSAGTTSAATPISITPQLDVTWASQITYTATPDGTQHAAWVHRNPLFGTPAAILVSSRPVDGRWSTPRRIAAAGHKPVVQVRSGRLHVTWATSVYGTAHLGSTRSATGVWSRPSPEPVGIDTNFSFQIEGGARFSWDSDCPYEECRGWSDYMAHQVTLRVTDTAGRPRAATSTVGGTVVNYAVARTGAAVIVEHGRDYPPRDIRVAVAGPTGEFSPWENLELPSGMVLPPDTSSAGRPRARILTDGTVQVGAYAMPMEGSQPSFIYWSRSRSGWSAPISLPLTDTPAPPGSSVGMLPDDGRGAPWPTDTDVRQCLQRTSPPYLDFEKDPFTFCASDGREYTWSALRPTTDMLTYLYDPFFVGRQRTGDVARLGSIQIRAFFAAKGDTYQGLFSMSARQAKQIGAAVDPRAKRVVLGRIPRTVAKRRGWVVLTARLTPAARTVFTRASRSDSRVRAIVGRAALYYAARGKPAEIGESFEPEWRRTKPACLGGFSFGFSSGFPRECPAEYYD